MMQCVMHSQEHAQKHAHAQEHAHAQSVPESGSGLFRLRRVTWILNVRMVGSEGPK